MSRQIVLDTETTGLLVDDNNRIIEIGCVEIINRKITGSIFHEYINPNRKSETRALEIHGLTEEFLNNKPVFASVSNSFIDYIKGAELIIHNAPFDIGFLNFEFSLLNDPVTIESICTVCDSLVLAKEIYPGARNSLDALCTRLDVNNSDRTVHGALLDSKILAEVYLLMTSRQFSMDLNFSKETMSTDHNLNIDNDNLPQVLASKQELLLHDKFITKLKTT